MHFVVIEFDINTFHSFEIAIGFALKLLNSAAWVVVVALSMQ